jgi:peptidoglycan hydrolase-like amidase
MGAHQEPRIRIGVILPDDRQDHCDIQIPEEPYLLEAGDQRLTLTGGKLQIATCEHGVCVLRDDARIASASLVRVQPVVSVPLERGRGARLFGLVAGRGFHWQKTIDPTFTGALEFTGHGGRLLAVNELALEPYLAGVIAAEMSGECPLEFLRSQCLVARSWVLAHTEDKHSELGIDRCNDDCCQRYQGTLDMTAAVLEAVHSTHGQVITDGRQHIIDANYSKSCGGIIESPEHVWRQRKIGQRPAVDAPPGSSAARFFPLQESRLEEFIRGDWLRTTDIFCSPNVVPEKDVPRYLGRVDEGGGHFRWTVRYRRAELEDVLRRKFFTRRAGDPLGTLMNLTVIARGDSGRAKQLRVDYRDPAGRPRSVDLHTEYNIRDALHPSFLFSSAFLVEISRDDQGVPQQIELTGAGWGHGAGLCQIGALGMALRGHTAEQILSHYFSPMQLHRCY